MTFFGLVGLLIFIYMRPHEFIATLEPVPFLYLFLALVVAGIGLEVYARRSRFIASPLHGYVLAFWAYCLLSLLARKPSAFGSQAISVSVAVTLYFVLAHGVQSVTRFLRTTIVIFSLGLFVAF